MLCVTLCQRTSARQVPQRESQGYASQAQTALRARAARSQPCPCTSYTTCEPRLKPWQVRCTTDSAETSDLAVLSCKAFLALTADPSFEGYCKVWEGDGYGDYYGQLHGQVMLLYEGAEAPPQATEPSEALLLHGCTAEAVEAEADADPEDGFELSIADAEGEVFSLSLTDEATRAEWCDAFAARSAPPAIAKASHILLKYSGSRRTSSWRDPDGVEILKRSEAAARKQLLSFKRMLEHGERTFESLAEEASDCDTAQNGGDLDWFASGYMQPEFEEAVLELEVRGWQQAFVSVDTTCADVRARSFCAAVFGHRGTVPL